MAAVWIPLLSPEEIAEEIARGIDFLTAEVRDLPDRQRSIRAVFESSWDRLRPAERRAFAAMSTFRGGFSRSAAREVAGAGLPLLRRLCDTSFVAVDGGGRYAVHELLRQFAAEKLGASGRSDEVEVAHLDHTLGWLATHEPLLRGAGQTRALSEIGADWDNVGAAWQAALRRGRLDAVDGALESLHLFADAVDRSREVIGMLDRALESVSERPEHTALRGRLLARRAFLSLLYLHDHAPVEVQLREAIAIARDRGAEAEVAFAEWALGTYLMVVANDLAAADPLIERSQRTFERLGDTLYACRVLYALALLRFEDRPYGEVLALVLRALELSERAGLKLDRAHILTHLIDLALVTGDRPGVERWSDEAAAIGEELGIRSIGAYVDIVAALLALFGGDVAAAERRLASADAVLGDIDYLQIQVFAGSVRSVVSLAQGEPERALVLAEASLSSEVAQGIEVWIARWGRALALATLGDAPTAWGQLAELLTLTERFGPAIATWALPIAAALESAAGKAERAVELLALGAVHPRSPQALATTLPLSADLVERLGRSLGDARLSAAWDRGRSLDLAEVAEALRLRATGASADPPA
jgi:hypothetical protein